MIPTVDELEISLFGPGYGESVLIHVGEGNWIIVDSCVDNQTNQPAALHYLKNIGVDPSESVKLIIATHWHDDHVRGLGKTFEECIKAAFVCTTAIQTREFAKLIERNKIRNNLSDMDSGVDEFTSILKILRSRNKHPKYALADRKIWHFEPEDSSFLSECKVYSLSPSDVEVDKTLNDISKIIPDIGMSLGRMPAPSQNDSAVVLWVDMGHENIVLLGSDLEENSNDQTGWSAIIKSYSAKSGKASIFKVAHHGSNNGFHQPVWDEMLYPKSSALLTPFTRGKVSLPSERDTKRILSKTDNAYITSRQNSSKKVKSRERFVTKIIDQYTLSIRTIEPSCGHIKMRRSLRKPDEKWEIELKGGASEL